MRKVAWAVASVVLLGAGSAAAQEISNIQYQAGSSYFNGDGEGGTVETKLPAGVGQFPKSDVGGNFGATYDSFVTVGGDAITFESSNATTQGPFASFSSYSTVSFDVYTDSTVNFHSEITPQGLGLYLADTSNGCLFTGSCVQVSDELHQFSDLTFPDYYDTTGLLGGVGFSFEILMDGSSIYSLSGSVLMSRNIGCDGFCLLTNLDDPEGPGAQLDGFSMQTDVNDLSAIAFGWGATPLDLGPISGFHSFEYRTSAFSFTNAACIDYGSVCLLGYSGFGDPIGRGGAIDALSAFDVGAYTHGGDELINGVHFTPAKFRLGFEDGNLVYQSAGVPEPGTWALTIMGFGILGAALRRRHIPAHI